MRTKFGFQGFSKPTPAKLKKISAFVETTFATIGASQLVTSKPELAAIFLILAGITNKFFEMFYEDDNSNSNPGAGAN